MKLIPSFPPLQNGKQKFRHAASLLENASSFLNTSLTVFGGYVSRSWDLANDWSDRLLYRVRQLGFTASLDDYEKRKLGIFNLVNFFQLITGVLVPFFGLVNFHRISAAGLFIACLPALTSVVVLVMNGMRRYEAAMLTYFALYPVLTSIVYLGGLNLGIELFFILYGILAVFFIQDKGHMIFSILLSMMSYFILTVVWRNYQFQLEVGGTLFLFNHLLAMAFIFYGLYLIKNENTGYQSSILEKNTELRRQYLEIEKQRTELALSSGMLRQQAEELQELNTIKNKLFSVIAHDLKTPMYGLRNLFTNMEGSDLPAEEIKAFVPDIVKDLNHTVALMDNLLNWAKSQMQSGQVHKEKICLHTLTSDVFLVLRIQADTKRILLRNDTNEDLQVIGDKDMILLVLRNLVSNAIKFSPKNATVKVSSIIKDGRVEVAVIDEGVGISAEAIERISANQYYTTSGTSCESGTGLGLMLCRDFLVKNDSRLQIESCPDKGSRFYFSLPLSQQ